MTQTRVGDLAAAGAAVLFGSSYVATAFALHSFGPLPIAFWRGLLAAIVVGSALRAGLLGGDGGARGGDSTSAVATPDRPQPTPAARFVRLAVLGMLGGPVFNVALNVAVGTSGATITAFVAGLYAVLAAVLAPLVLRERLGTRALVGFVVALGGTALLAQIQAGAPSAGGIGAALIGAFAFATYLLLSRRWADQYDLSGGLIAEANFITMAVVTLVGVGVLGAGPLVPASIEPAAAVALIWLALGPSAGAQLLLVASVRRIPARRSAAFLLLNPITATILAAILLGERLASLQLVGAALVLAGIAVASGLLQSLVGRVATRAIPPSVPPAVPPGS